MDKEFVAVLDFGGQYNQLIARRVRELGVYSELLPFDITAEELKKYNPIGIIFTGGPCSVYEDNAPVPDAEVFNLGVPILAICYGQHITAKLLGGGVEKASLSEYGHADVTFKKHILFDGIKKKAPVWMSHTDHVTALPDGFSCYAQTDNCRYSSIIDDNRRIYGVQFHPEVKHTPDGMKIFENFIYKICKAKGGWNMKNYAQNYIKIIAEKLKDKKALCALSGGVDSSVAAVLLSKALGKNLTCIFVDHGLLRKNEGDEVERIFKDFDINFLRVNVEERFLQKLDGVNDPEKKRKIIGEEFIRVFEEEAAKIGQVDYLVQGTIYPDVIESGKGKSAVIKSHHNVGGLPKNISFKEIIEPLRDLFKDEVRALGLELGLPPALVYRQPFPGPGLAVRVIGAITKEKLDTLRDADAIFREEIALNGLDGEINQYFAVITDVKTVGVKGDGRSYEYTLVLRAVTTVDFMTADFAKIPYAVLGKISGRIVNEVKNINRVVYDITSKPPATIEWE